MRPKYRIYSVLRYLRPDIYIYETRYIEYILYYSKYETRYIEYILHYGINETRYIEYILHYGIYMRPVI